MGEINPLNSEIYLLPDKLLLGILDKFHYSITVSTTNNTLTVHLITWCIFILIITTVDGDLMTKHWTGKLILQDSWVKDDIIII